MDEGGRGALLMMLKERIITNNLRLAPDTQGLMDQRKLSHRHDSLLNFLSEIIMKGFINSIDINATVGEDIRWAKTVRAFEFFGEYRDWARDTRVPVFDTLSAIVFAERIEGYGFRMSDGNLSVPDKETLNKMVNINNGSYKEK
jgi:hypothetical protein